MVPRRHQAGRKAATQAPARSNVMLSAVEASPVRRPNPFSEQAPAGFDRLPTASVDCRSRVLSAIGDRIGQTATRGVARARHGGLPRLRLV